MPKGIPLDQDKEAAIISALRRVPHASLVAREDGGVSFATVWRVAERAGIALTAGRRTMGRHRLSEDQRRAVIEARRANPHAAQQEIARAAGVSRSTVWRIERARRGNGPAAKPG